MSKKEKYEKQTAYRERMKEKGLMYVQVWVPAEEVEQVKEYAKKLREKRGERQAMLLSAREQIDGLLSGLEKTLVKKGDEKGLAELNRCRKILSNQDELEPEYRRVLVDNLWDLYGS